MTYLLDLEIDWKKTKILETMEHQLNAESDEIKSMFDEIITL